MRRKTHSPPHSHVSPIVAVGGVVYRRTRRGQIEFLLIKKRAGFWTLPKGKVMVGEALTDAVAREVGEETGLSGAVERMVRQISYEIWKNGAAHRKVVTFYLVRANGGVLRPSKKEQIEKARWFPIPAALQRIGRLRVRAIAEQATRLLDPVVGFAGLDPPQ